MTSRCSGTIGLDFIERCFRQAHALGENLDDLTKEQLGVRLRKISQIWEDLLKAYWNVPEDSREAYNNALAKIRDKALMIKDKADSLQRASSSAPLAAIAGAAVAGAALSSLDQSSALPVPTPLQKSSSPSPRPTPQTQPSPRPTPQTQPPPRQSQQPSRKCQIGLINAKDLESLLKNLIIMQQIARVRHFNTQSYSFHKATDFLYKEIDPIIDKIGEISGRPEMSRITFDLCETDMDFFFSMGNFRKILMRSEYGRGVDHIVDDIILIINRFIFLASLE